MPYKKRSRSDEYVASSQDRETNNDQNVEPMTAKSNKRTKAPRKVTHKAVKIVNVAYAEANERGEKIPITKLERHKKGKDDFTAIAWNVDSLRALLNHNVQELIDLCKEEQPNVIGFMNIRLSDEEMCEQCDQLLRAAVENILGPVETVWNRCTAKKGYSGTAMIVRKSVGKFDSKLGISDHADPEGRTITLEFDDMVVVLCYVPNSGHGLYRLAYRTSGRRCFDAELAEYCKSFDKPTLLLGDMNVADRDVDIWNVDKPYIPKKSGTAMWRSHPEITRTTVLMVNE
ncbi:conserved hypothetical protein [Perkinsus marinus ATCC 50983]|uniref:Endonuclease/exonuclease/phosphatase domain-containing protein n=1 Tax=Perkinsus marinus (strain ATCC 50983 / TXsc) TaxID=423536 RepID=C5KUG0_PERM5|nr:conserved hypothetical protein [Perkinsus marinus ATCC 50983]EER11847.1 conserved hypothetical protein [Perkinsus marinus ATCC 50983]|eukprot:XP_002780052.1 conserved hypothetical protein [Perkinsus marinus ATCC 50983]